METDFSHASPGDTLAMLEGLPRAFEGQELNSVRILADLRNVSYDPGVSQKWKAALVKYSPYLRASAVFGATGLAEVGTMAAIELMHWLRIPFPTRKLRLFKTREQALAWLLKT